MLAVHFKSRDLTRLQSQGRFWHCLFLSGGVLVSQDEVETWTVHRMEPTDVDNNIASIEPHEFIFDTLGGLVGSYPIKVDEVLMKTKWRSDLAIADSFRSAKGRVLLAGDAGMERDRCPFVCK
jgi:hypothetical protein